MKRFLCRCAALFLVVAVLLWVGGLAYKQTTTYKNLDRTEETEKYHAMPDGITFAVFGASHGRDAFQAADYPDETFFNFSMSSQTPLYDLMQLRQFRGHLTPGATVVVTVSYMSPFWTESEDSFSDKQERYYRILSPQNIVDCDVGHWVLVRWSPLLTNDCTDVLSAFIHPPELRADTNTLYGQQVLSPQDIAGEQQRIQKDHLTAVEPAMPDGNPVMLDALREIAALCRENAWNAVFVTPPYPDVYTQCYSTEILGCFQDLMTSLSAQTGVPWLDYSRDADFSGQYSYFKNIDHLNLSGAKVFSQALQEDLAALIS